MVKVKKGEMQIKGGVFEIMYDIDTIIGGLVSVTTNDDFKDTLLGVTIRSHGGALEYLTWVLETKYKEMVM